MPLMPSLGMVTNDRVTATQFVIRNRGGTEVRKLNCHHGPGRETSRGRWGKMRQRIMIYRFPIATYPAATLNFSVRVFAASPSQAVS